MHEVNNKTWRHLSLAQVLTQWLWNLQSIGALHIIFIDKGIWRLIQLLNTRQGVVSQLT